MTPFQSLLPRHQGMQPAGGGLVQPELSPLNHGGEFIRSCVEIVDLLLVGLVVTGDGSNLEEVSDFVLGHWVFFKGRSIEDERDRLYTKCVGTLTCNDA